MYTQYEVRRGHQIFVPMHLYGKNIENSVSQNVLKTICWKLQYMIKVSNRFSCNQMFVPRVIYTWPLAMYMFKIS